MKKVKITLSMNETQIFKIYHNIEKKLINSSLKNSFKNREIVIDIDGKTFDEIKLELNSLKLDDKLGLDIVLVGDVEQGYIDSLHKYISKFNNPLCNIEWVIGEATADIVKDIDEKYQMKIARVLSNGYLLTVNGGITEEFYNALCKEIGKENLTEREIEVLINSKFYNNESLDEFYDLADKKIANNFRQLVIGKACEIKSLEDNKKENANLKELIVNKKISNNVKVMQIAENGLTFSNEVGLEKIQSVSDMINIQSNDNLVDSTHIVGKEAIILEGLDGKAMAIAKVKSTFVRNLSILLTKLGMSKFMEMNSEKKMKLNVEAIRSMASAA